MTRLSAPAAIIVTLAVVVLASSPLWAQDATAPHEGLNTVAATPAPIPPAPPANVRAKDAPNDHGHALVVEWDLSSDDGQGRNNVLSYLILRSPALRGPYPVDSLRPSVPELRHFHSAVYNEAVWRISEGEWDTVGVVPSGGARYEHRGAKDRGATDFFPDEVPFSYKVIATTADAQAVSPPSDPVQSRGQIIHLEKLLHIGIPTVVFTALVLGFIGVAKRGYDLYIRPLAGISAVDEAIGRATEMNRPILYVLGLGAADEIATIASFTILSRVAKKVAEHRTELLVPCYDPVVMSIAQETVKQAYLDAGRPDEYKEDMVHYVTQEQFAYTAAVNGMMIRRQTATNFYLGVFFAESLILAETGSMAGSIQISGTDRTTQLPFFIVACDYTLIGEELYAASAYLGREPKLLGTLKAQDWAKGMFMFFMIVGIIGAALQWDWVVQMFTMGI